MDWIGLAPYVCLGLTALGGLGVYLFTNLQKKVETNERDTEKAIGAIRDKSSEEIAELRDQLAAHRLHVAETYVTQEGLTKAISSLDQTINRLIETVTQYGKDTREALSELHRRIDGKADK